MIAGDFGQYVTSALCIATSNAVADSPTDGVEVEGATIDRKADGNNDIARGAVVVVPWSATLSEAETVALMVRVQESSDGSSWDDAETISASAVVATGEVGGGTYTGVVEIDDNLMGRKRYVRYNVTPELSQADTESEATDTVTFSAVALFGGYSNLTV